MERINSSSNCVLTWLFSAIADRICAQNHCELTIQFANWCRTIRTHITALTQSHRKLSLADIITCKYLSTSDLFIDTSEVTWMWVAAIFSHFHYYLDQCKSISHKCVFADEFQNAWTKTIFSKPLLLRFAAHGMHFSWCTADTSDSRSISILLEYGSVSSNLSALYWDSGSCNGRSTRDFWCHQAKSFLFVAQCCVQHSQCVRGASHLLRNRDQKYAWPAWKCFNLDLHRTPHHYHSHSGTFNARTLPLHKWTARTRWVQA